MSRPNANGHLDYVSQLAKHLGMADPVETYLTPVLGSWRDVRDESARWRAAAKVAEDVARRLTAPLGGLDAAWQGKDANSFLDYMQKVGLAGNDLSDAMTAMADALDRVEDSVRQIVRELVDLLADTAEQLSDAVTVPVAGESRARQHLDAVASPARRLYESVRDVLEAFVRLCDGVPAGSSGAHLTLSHAMPAQNWSPPTAQPVGRPSAPPVSPLPAPTPLPIRAQPAPPQGSPPPASPPPATHPAALPPAAVHHHGGAPAGASGMVGHSGHLGGGATPAMPAAHGGSGFAAEQSAPPAHSGAVPDNSGNTQGAQHIPGSGTGAASPAAQGGQGQPGGMGMGGMGGGGRGGGGDQEHKSKIRISGDIRDIFGKPDRTTPPVIGEE
jgi:uncharacterized protein YukE